MIRKVIKKYLIRRSNHGENTFSGKYRVIIAESGQIKGHLSPDYNMHLQSTKRENWSIFGTAMFLWHCKKVGCLET